MDPGDRHARSARRDRARHRAAGRTTRATSRSCSSILARRQTRPSSSGSARRSSPTSNATASRRRHEARRREPLHRRHRSARTASDTRPHGPHARDRSCRRRCSSARRVAEPEHAPMSETEPAHANPLTRRTWTARRSGASSRASRLALVPIVVATVRAIRRDWIPVGDDAFFVIRPRDVFNQHRPLLGTWTSASTNASGSTSTIPGRCCSMRSRRSSCWAAPRWVSRSARPSSTRSLSSASRSSRTAAVVRSSARSRWW